MKKNKMMRLASLLLVMCLLTTSVISGTFAKYTTTVSSDDSARVARWGFNTDDAEIEFEDLFKSSYDHVAVGSDTQAIIAPGTKGDVSFTFENSLDDEEAPEVKYSFKVDAKTESSCAEAIQKSNITWSLKEGDTYKVTKGTWTDLMDAIEALDGDEEYEPGEMPEMIDETYTVEWEWPFESHDDGNDNGNYNDSAVGNLAAEGDLVVTLAITITAEQVNN